MTTRFSLLLALVAALILGSSLLYTRYLSRQLAANERHIVELYANGLDLIANTDPATPEGAEEYQTFVFSQILQNANDRIPRMLVSPEGEVLDAVNIGIPDTLPPAELRARRKAAFAALKDQQTPIRVEYAPGQFQEVYYGESLLLTQLRWFPVAQLVVAFAFLGLLFGGFVMAKRSEQNKVWAGMARETAHQLGTPISSLAGWTELLHEGMPMDDEMLASIDQDVERLQTIAERFSKIGSVPELSRVSLADTLDQAVTYISMRMPKSIRVALHNPLSADRELAVNPQLFNWVIENLLKNALDAIVSKSHEGGEISLTVTETAKYYILDISDTGKGMPKSLWKKVFQPGFTTKKRGWGLGLSLARRIVQEYHKGRIYVLRSEVGVGTTFRLMLPKNAKSKKS